MIDFLPAKTGGPPFFAYLAFTAPHYPLHAPHEDIARYKGHYDKGYDVLRAEWLARLKAMKLAATNVIPHPPSSSERWEALTPEQRQIEARKMEVHAAMVDRLDQNVGRLVATLKQRGLYDNTLILFLSDNGAEGHQLDKSVIAAEQGKQMLARGDNSLGSIGTARSYTWYGPNWAEAATTPSRLYKSFPTEGGTRVVAFMSGPHRARAQMSDLYVSVRDVVPTVLDYAHVPVTANVAGKARLAPQGHSVCAWIDPTGKGGKPPEVVANGEMFGRLYAR